jgi:hypothetical protein
MNVEHRTSNIERRINVFYLFKKRFSEAILSFDIRYSIFCGSLFYFREVSYERRLAASVQSDRKRNFWNVVSYKRSRWPKNG